MSIFDLLDESKYVNSSVKRRRVAICKNCPDLFTPTNQCKKCACFVNQKAKLSTESCPKGKWWMKKYK